MTFGHPHRHLRRCESTNAIARELAAGGAAAGTVVTADEQTAGRGRQGRTWTAPRGKALLYSAVLCPLEERHLLLPLAVPLAVADAVEAIGGGPCAVKWPNDVWIGGRKAAGVLIEARPRDRWAVIGVGLNVAIEAADFPPELRDTATSVGHGTVAEARVALNAALSSWAAAGAAQILARFRERDALRGGQVAWPEGRGRADGVDARGNLVVITPGGDRVTLGAGEVHLTSAGGA